METVKDLQNRNKAEWKSLPMGAKFLGKMLPKGKWLGQILGVTVASCSLDSPPTRKKQKANQGTAPQIGLTFLPSDPPTVNDLQWRKWKLTRKSQKQLTKLDGLEPPGDSAPDVEGGHRHHEAVVGLPRDPAEMTLADPMFSPLGNRYILHHGACGGVLCGPPEWCLVCSPKKPHEKVTSMKRRSGGGMCCPLEDVGFLARMTHCN